MTFRQNFKTGMRTLLVSGLVLSILFVILSISCQAPAPTPTPTPSPTPTSIEVEISDFAFVPATITVSVGATITWTNNDPAPHTVTSRDTVFDSGNLSRGATFSYTFDQSGTFEYYCTIHPNMTGKVTVE